MEHEQTITDQRKEDGAGPDSDTSGLPAEPAGPPAGPSVPRRRRRTVLLIAAAAALGVLAGTVTGYAIQYDREPTPLPPLAQQKIDQPKPQAPNESTSTRTINAGRWDTADDELAKLLIEAPSGARVRFSGSQSLDEFSADYYKQPGSGLANQIDHDVRRIAALEWAQDDRNSVTIRLFQYRNRSGADWYQHAHGYLDTKEYMGNPGKDLPGVPADFGHLWVASEQREKAGGLPTKWARVVARRGGIVMEIEYMDNRGVVDENDVAEIAKRQWERL